MQRIIIALIPHWYRAEMTRNARLHPGQLNCLTTDEFVAYLHTLDIRLAVDGERLQCSAPKGVLTDELRQELAARKAELLVWLRANGDGHGVAAEGLAVDGYYEPLSFSQQCFWGMEPLQLG